MLYLLIAQAAGLNVPVIDHSKAVAMRPISANVTICASPNALPLMRIMDKVVASGQSVRGYDEMAKAGGCLLTFNTNPLMVDFQEDVSWAGAVRPPRMLSGTLRIARVRFSVPLPGYPNLQGYYYAAAEDLRPMN